jgi:hypothetical protein
VVHPELLRPAYGRPPAAGDEERARWRELRRARDPAPEVFEGTGGMASWARAMGEPAEAELRKVPGLSWWYDPDLPLGLIRGGMPHWRDEVRETGETAEEFEALTADFERLLPVTVFPPMTVVAVDPAADREALGRWGYIALCPETWRLQTPHYLMAAGRHRLAAAMR